MVGSLDALPVVTTNNKQKSDVSGLISASCVSSKYSEEVGMEMAWNENQISSFITSTNDPVGVKDSLFVIYITFFIINRLVAPPAV